VLLARSRGVGSELRLSHRQITTHAGAPLMIVNGDRGRIGLNGEPAFWTGLARKRDDRRAMRLVLMNLAAQFRYQDMSQTGIREIYLLHRGKREHQSVGTLHIERGFSAKQRSSRWSTRSSA